MPNIASLSFGCANSIIRERLADPAYAGDETYKIEEDKFGNPVTPYLNWKKPIPWKRPNEDELRAIESVYVTNPRLRGSVCWMRAR